MHDGLTQLHTLANLYGVRTTYLDMTNKTRTASVESLVAALKSLDAPLNGLADIPNALKEKQRGQWRELMEPVITVPMNEVLTVNLKLPFSTLNKSIKAVLNLESGQKQEFSWRIEESSVISSQSVDNKRYCSVRLYLPGKLPMGYHQLFVEIPGQSAEALIISHPQKAYQPPSEEKIWGLFSPLYALHTNNNWGAGDFSDLNELFELTIKQGGRLVGTLPLLASFFDKDYGPGPYLPASRFFWNEFYLDLEQVLNVINCPETLKLLETNDFQKNLKELESSKQVNYEKVLRLKRKILETLANCVFNEKSQVFNEFVIFVKQNPYLSEYAAFREAGEINGINFDRWPKNAVNICNDIPDQTRLKARYFMFSQWLTEKQLGRLAKKARENNNYLYMDMPVGIHPYSYDVWKHPEIFARKASTGAPPDPVFTNGQNWNFPPLHPENIRRQKYHYFIESLRKQLSVAGMLRLDHVMNFHRLYWIPQGVPTSEGVYINYKADEFYSILALESFRFRSTIVGEDLGMVPPEVRPMMEKHGLFRTFVGQYELIAENQLGNIPRHAVATLNTHDMFPFAAFWQEQDILERQKMKLLTNTEASKEIEQRRQVKRSLISILQYRGLTNDLAQDTEANLKAIIFLLAASPAYAVILNLEDLWLETKPQNVPGTIRKQNWTHKTKFSLKKMEKAKDINQFLVEITNTRKGICPD